MKKNELKSLAKQIARLEKKLVTSSDPTEIRECQEKIIILSNRIEDLDDLFALDDLIQKNLEKI